MSPARYPLRQNRYVFGGLQPERQLKARVLRRLKPAPSLAQAFHSMTVTGLDTCVRKPLVATCGTDKSVRIWNYLDKSTTCRPT